MIINIRTGAPVSPTNPITVSAGNAPLTHGELSRLKKRRKKDQPIGPEDEPLYMAKVQKERKALALEKQSLQTN